jgi:hypothetical protein
MSGSFLLGLVDKVDARRRQKRPNPIRLMAHHNGGVAQRCDGRCRLDHMLDQCQAARAVQHFRTLGFHPGAEAGGQDHHVGLGCHLLG